MRLAEPPSRAARGVGIDPQRYEPARRENVTGGFPKEREAPRRTAQQKRARDYSWERSGPDSDNDCDDDERQHKRVGSQDRTHHRWFLIEERAAARERRHGLL